MADTDLEVPDTSKLTSAQKQCIDYMEQVYFTSGQLPTAASVADKLDMKEAAVSAWMSDPIFRYSLKFKGLLETAPEGVLTGPQLMIANMLLNIRDKRSDREKCNEVGITTHKLAVWRRDPVFIKYMNDRAERMFKDAGDAAYTNLLKNIQSGNLKAAQLFFEMTGKYQKSVRHDISIDSILVKMIEILQVRIRDPELLETIAQDFEDMMDGKPLSFESNPARKALPEAIEAQIVQPPVGKADELVQIHLEGINGNL